MSPRQFGRLRALVLATCAISASASALDRDRAITQYTHDSWNADNGLPQNSVQAIAQTPDGYLWLGTQEGLARFDGVRFTVFDAHNESALKNSNILALCSSADGSLWIGTRGGGLVRFRGRTVQRYGPTNGLTSNVVRAIFEDSRRRLWVGTENGLFQLAGGRFLASGSMRASTSDVVMAIAEWTGDLWYGTDGGGIRRLRGGDVHAFTHMDGLPSDAVRALYSDGDRGLWIGTRGGGLARYQDGRFTSFAQGNPAWATIGSGAVRRDIDGNLWVGTRGGGLLRLRENRIDSFAKKNGFSSDIVMCVYEDRERTLWIGTDGEGLHRFTNGKLKTFSSQEGLRNDMLLPIFEDRHGILWLGSYGGGLHSFREGVFTAFTKAQGLSSDMVVSLADDADGDLWVGTDGGGLNRYREGKFAHFGAIEGLSGDRVVSLLVTSDGTLWIGTYGGGLDSFGSGRFTSYGRAQGLLNDRVVALTEDRDGTLWIGTDGGGAYRYRGGRFEALTTAHGLADDVVYRIYQDADGVFWIGTAAGLSRWKDGRFTTYDTQVGLFDNKVFQILEDDDGNLWMSSNKGIFRVAREQLNEYAAGKIRAIACVSYGKSDGMKSSECNGTSQPAGWKRRDGTLWFPTTMGAVEINPRKLVSNPLPPPVSIEDVIVDKRHVNFGSGLRVPPGNGEIEVHFTGLSLVDPSRVRFRYRLEGFDRAWVDAGTRRTAYYTNTPPGHYRFRVVACNNDGIWNEQGASMAFYLEPHFYQTFWFLGLCVFGVALAGGAAHRYRVRELTRRKFELMRLVSERTEQLEAANQVLQRLSSQDGLTGVANRRHFDESLDREWRRCLREKTPLSLIMLDLDSFKPYNDLYGHQQGDECLKSVASTLSCRLTRAADLCARYGGEEFGIILPGTDGDGAAWVAEDLRAAIERLRLPHRHSRTAGVVTASLGVSWAAPSAGGSPSDLIRRADAALYRAKTSGRNRVCLADAGAMPASQSH